MPDEGKLETGWEKGGVRYRGIEWWGPRATLARGHTKWYIRKPEVEWESWAESYGVL